MSEYPFMVHLPDIVSESVMLKFEDAHLCHNFFLKTQLNCVDPSFITGGKDGVSKIRTDYALYTHQPQVEEEKKLGHPAGGITPGFENPELSKSVTVQVGGVAGLGSTPSTARITIEKLRFAPGETIKVNFNVDNTKCKKAIKSFKIKLLRRVQCWNAQGRKPGNKPALVHEEYLVSNKYEGGAEKTQIDKVIDFKMPEREKNVGTLNGLNPDMIPMVKQLSESVECPLFTIEYQLECFVKHQSKLEFGMGNSLTFNIKVKNSEYELPWVPDLER